MPHIIVKLVPGKSAAQKQQLADEITRDVMSILNYGNEAVSVAFDEIPLPDWAEKVYRADIRAHPEKLYKKPGYTM
jgi:4-oxalocrotonate tautomerase